MALVAAYAFNEGTGTTAAEASGGTTLTGVPAWDTGLHGSALRLNLVNGPAVDPYVSSGAFTIMFDVYIVGSGNGSYNLFIDGTIGEIGIIQQASGGSLEWYPWFGPTGTTIATATWTHVAVVATGTDRRIVVNGTQAGTTANTELSGTNPFTLGGESGFEPNIRMDNLRIYDTALSNAEIAALAGTAVSSGTAYDKTPTDAVGLTDSVDAVLVTPPVAYVSQGAPVAGTTSITTAEYGAGWAEGDLGVFVVASNHATVEATEPTVAGFTNVGTLNGGGGAQGAGTGNRRLTFFTRELLAGDDTTPTVSLATGNVMVAACTIFRKPASGYSWAAAVSAFGAETTAGTAWSEAMTSNPVLDAEDMALLACAVRDTSASSAEGITATGATFGTVSERADLASETGNDINLHVNTCTVLTGPSSAAPTCTATHATSESGVMGVLRIRSTASGPTNYDKTPSDAVGLTDAPTAAQDNARTRDDAVGTTDSVMGALGFDRTPADPLGLTDSVAGALGFDRTQGDPVGLTDSVDAVLETGDITRTPADNVGLTDAVSVVVTSVRTAADLIGITDTDSPMVLEFGEAVDDAVGLTDSVAVVQTRVVTVADPVGITDTATPSSSGDTVATPSDAVPMGDVTAFALDGVRAPSDPVGLLDAATAAATGVRTSADQLALTDSVVAVLERVVTIADSVAMADFATSFVGVVATPASRTIVVPAESRVLTVNAEDRTTVVPPENRTMEA